MNNLHFKEVRTYSDLDPYNIKTRDIPFDEKVAIVMHQSEDYGDLTSISTINELLDKLKKEDYSITHSAHANRIMAYNDRNGIGHSICIEYYSLS